MGDTERFRVGQRVMVNTGGADYKGTIGYDKPPSAALKGCYLVSFDNGTAQWMNREVLRSLTTQEATADMISDAAIAIETFSQDDLETYATAIHEAFERGYNDRKTGHDMDKPLQPGERRAYVNGYRQAEREAAE